MEHLAAVRSEHTLGVELDASDVERLVLEGHDLPLVALGRNLQTVGEVLLRNHPRVVTSDGDIARDATEDGIVAGDVTRGSHTMEHIAEVLELSSEGLADGLMT